MNYQDAPPEVQRVIREVYLSFERYANFHDEAQKRLPQYTRHEIKTLAYSMLLSMPFLEGAINAAGKVYENHN